MAAQRTTNWAMIARWPASTTAPKPWGVSNMVPLREEAAPLECTKRAARGALLRDVHIDLSFLYAVSYIEVSFLSNF